MPPTDIDSEADNIVIYVNEKIYSIPPSVYTDEKHRIQDDDHARGVPVWNALEKGVVLAKLHGLGVGVGGFCTLLNLPALTPPPVQPPPALSVHFKRQRVDNLALIKTISTEDLPQTSPLGLEHTIDGTISVKLTTPKE
jgi:hypothetical protein